MCEECGLRSVGPTLGQARPLKRRALSERARSPVSLFGSVPAPAAGAGAAAPATATAPEIPDDVQQLMQMGFAEKDCRAALEEQKGDLQRAVSFIMGDLTPPRKPFQVTYRGMGGGYGAKNSYGYPDSGYDDLDDDDSEVDNYGLSLGICRIDVPQAREWLRVYVPQLRDLVLHKDTMEEREFEDMIEGAITHLLVNRRVPKLPDRRGGKPRRKKKNKSILWFMFTVAPDDFDDWDRTAETLDGEDLSLEEAAESCMNDILKSVFETANGDYEEPMTKNFWTGQVEYGFELINALLRTSLDIGATGHCELIIYQLLNYSHLVRNERTRRINRNNNLNREILKLQQENKELKQTIAAISGHDDLQDEEEDDDDDDDDDHFRGTFLSKN